MFQGETAVTLDDKGRLALPVAYRSLVASACANRLVFTYNPFEEGCLWLLPQSEWESMRDRVNALSNMKDGHRLLKLKLVGAAALVEPDGGARVLVPASQRAAVGIEKRAILVGMGDKFELWGEQAHLSKIRQTIGEGDLSDEMLDLRL
ncbi:MAG: division/cell wall cluster transcriptional repressor MraZ [Proteobacteria bacterium]|nr:division/cell wall cluster transcriptional repressor MraZ [Pseudomonadota bacterium]